MTVLEIIGHAIVVIGLIFIAFGIVGIYKFKTFYQRMLVAAKIDTVGTVTVILGMVMIHGVSMFSLRLVLILVILLLLGPLSTHVVARTAYTSERDG